MQNVTILPRREAVSEQASKPGAISIKPPRPWLQDFSLWILLVGPLVAPLFVWLGWTILRPFADGIYLLGEAVCPKVDVHMMFLGHAMAVCSSCWAAVFGLWTVRLLFGRAGEGFGSLSRLGLSTFWARWQSAASPIKIAVLVVGFLPWAFDVMMWDLGAWNSPQAFMMLAGYIGGLTAGALLLPAASEMRARLGRNVQRNV
jgi:uncharacterized membrane protein